MYIYTYIYIVCVQPRAQIMFSEIRWYHTRNCRNNTTGLWPLQSRPISNMSMDISHDSGPKRDDW